MARMVFKAGYTPKAGRPVKLQKVLNWHDEKERKHYDRVQTKGS